tara:strand:- start:225 stop:452 length:228 start_codon:yes stop_codon:yes gene_type:complete
MTRTLIFSLLVSMLLALPEAADACSVCFSGKEETRNTYVGTTVFLSALPIGIVLGLGMMVRRRYVAPENKATGRS